MRALLEHRRRRGRHPSPNHQLQVLGSAFYRNKAAYVIGKIVNGHAETPFARARPPRRRRRARARHDPARAESINVLFSLSRAYFMVDMDVPSGYVQFLQTMMPTRSRARSSTRRSGSAKQGKTLFYRDLLHHLHHSRGRLRRGARDAAAW